jgi:hypothetical protein
MRITFPTTWSEDDTKNAAYIIKIFFPPCNLSVTCQFLSSLPQYWNMGNKNQGHVQSIAAEMKFLRWPQKYSKKLWKEPRHYVGTKEWICNDKNSGLQKKNGCHIDK